jgi:hypothetical protein
MPEVLARLKAAGGAAVAFEGLGGPFKGVFDAFFFVWLTKMFVCKPQGRRYQ